MNAKSVLLEAMQAVQSTSTNSTDTNVDGNISVTEHNDNDFFCFYDTPETSSSASAELDLYLNDSADQLETLNRCPLVKQVFIAKNTALPSSVPMERLFSTGDKF